MIEFLFSPDAKWLWTGVLTVALFFPVRKMIFVMTVRRAITKGGSDNVNEAEQKRLYKRAGFTAGLLCFLFALFYVGMLFKP
ncbi:MAG: hypothetical protein HQ512_09240 [Rhodospirillales bacterium]|nr:hypothetical protein [Rhodospirillales bacterium]